MPGFKQCLLLSTVFGVFDLVIHWSRSSPARPTMTRFPMTHAISQRNGTACGRVVAMTSPKTPKGARTGGVPNPTEILAAAQAAIEAAQAVAGSALDTAVRTPAASVALAAQFPDLIENLATAIERLNKTIDRVERMLALADPLFATLDQILPRLEQLAALADDLRKLMGRIPGADTLGRLAGVNLDDDAPTDKGKGRSR